VEPLAPGTVIVVPDNPDAATDAPGGSTADGPDEVAVSVAGARFRFWETITIERSLDAVDTFKLSAPMGAPVAGAFVPLSFAPASIAVGGVPLFTGTVVTVDPDLGNDAKRIAVGGYSVPGVMGDCTPPASAFPLEFRGQSLSRIAKTIATPFGVKVVFDSDAGGAFDLVACDKETTALAFLIDLAKKRGLLVSSTPAGALRFYAPTGTGAPVARFRQGVPPLQGVGVTIAPQGFYSSVTGVRASLIGRRGGQYTARNPMLPGVVRPYTFALDDTDTGTVRAAVLAKIGRMFGAVVSYSMTLPTWRTPAGNLWAPGDLVTMYAPDAMINHEYTLMVRAVTFSRSKAAATCALELVLPGSFSGQIPERMPWAV
jgi:prophage tail gpP-like protein